MEEYTVKEIAELLEVSKPTIQKTINKLAVKPERIDNRKRAYYSYENTIVIIQSIRPNFTEFEQLAVGENLQNEPPFLAQISEKPQFFSPNEPPSTAKPPNNETELLRETIEIIKGQLEQQRAEIEIKNKQIQDLNDRLAEAMELNKGLQYITAADKTTELLEASNKQQEEQPIIVNDSDVDEQASSWIPKDEITAEQEPEPQQPQKISFWKKLFG